MGYSCSAKAGAVMDALVAILQKAGPDPKNTSNGWMSKEAYHFFEVGRENADASITGTVWYSYTTPAGERAKKIGGFKINADGLILRWPTSTLVQRRDAEANGMKAFEQRFSPLVSFAG